MKRIYNRRFMLMKQISLSFWKPHQRKQVSQLKSVMRSMAIVIRLWPM